MAASGVEVWRIQALARHSSSAILAYIADSHIATLGSVAAEAAAGRSLDALRQELRSFQQMVKDGKLQQSAVVEAVQQSPQGLQVHISPEEALAPEPPPPPKPTRRTWVLSRHATGRLHIASRITRGLTVCGWAWLRLDRGFEVLEPQGAPPCDKCEKWAPTEPSSSSSSSSSGTSEGELAHVGR